MKGVSFNEKGTEAEVEPMKSRRARGRGRRRRIQKDLVEPAFHIQVQRTALKLDNYFLPHDVNDVL